MRRTERKMCDGIRWGIIISIKVGRSEMHERNRRAVKSVEGIGGEPFKDVRTNCGKTDIFKIKTKNNAKKNCV